MTKVFTTTTHLARAGKIRALIFSYVALACLLTGCHSKSCILEPCITYFPSQRLVQSLPSAFIPLSSEELKQEWGKELIIAEGFAREFDLYRAITAFKRAKFLISKNHPRLLQIDFGIVESYYLGQKYQDALETFEASSLKNASSSSFPGFRELLLILYDAYWQVGQEDKASQILQIIEKCNADSAEDLKLYVALNDGNFEDIICLSTGRPSSESYDLFLSEYWSKAKSVRKAQTLNAILPGAGYYYVGQKKSAMTSFLINALFTAAAYQLFDRGYVAGGLVVTSLEMGWYLGGINGAGLEAKEYNQSLYNNYAKEIMVKNRIFPVLMFETTF